MQVYVYVCGDIEQLLSAIARNQNLVKWKKYGVYLTVSGRQGLQMPYEAV